VLELVGRTPRRTSSDVRAAHEVLFDLAGELDAGPVDADALTQAENPG
jgi:hypothetical protein